MTSRYANYDDTPWFFGFLCSFYARNLTAQSDTQSTKGQVSNGGQRSEDPASPIFVEVVLSFLAKKTSLQTWKFWKVPNQHWLQKSTDTQQSHTWNTWNMMQPDQQPARKTSPRQHSFPPLVRQVNATSFFFHQRAQESRRVCGPWKTQLKLKWNSQKLQLKRIQN